MAILYYYVAVVISTPSENHFNLMLYKIKNKDKSNFVWPQSCVKISHYVSSKLFNFQSRSFSFAAAYQRVIPFYSIIRLKFDHIVDQPGAIIFKTYINCMEIAFNFNTNKNDIPINAAKSLISFPLMFYTLSTAMTNSIREHNFEVTLPLFTWGMLDKYFIRVERPNYGDTPGLFGMALSFINKEINFADYCRTIFNDKFLYDCLSGTCFDRLVSSKDSKDEHGNVYTSYWVSPSLRSALDARLQPFACLPYTSEFLVATSSFYSMLSTNFKTKLVTVTKSTDRTVNTDAGIHTFKNHKFLDSYICHKSVQAKFETQFFANTFIILTKVFCLEYFSSDENWSNPIPYGNGEVGNHEVYYDFTNVQLTDVFNTLFSSSISLHKRGGGGDQNITPSTCLAIDFGGRRHYSTNAIHRLRNFESDVGYGSIYYRIPIPSDSYTLVNDGNHSAIIYGSININ